MGPEELNRSWETGQQLIHANGTSYNVGGELQAGERSWPLDPIPLILDESEWTEIDAAVSQRATLLNAMLADFYGPQRLLHQKQLPPALLLANPNFLRPCHGIQPMGGVFLHSYAVDMARGPDGRWRVTSDRTQAPSGLGYTLENRLVSARSLSNVFNTCRLRQLMGFFEARRYALLSLAARQQQNPRIVLLTPGTHAETYFEHSFLAGHWGFPLVEGADLAVRDNRVYLKTLTGLEPVDLIIRRMDDSYCDPIELRGDSVLGVPGLVQAVRAGNVAIDNALGSGVPESPGILPYLPALCRFLLGEELRMSSLETWWCGEDSSLNYAVEHLAELVVRPAFPRSYRQMQLPGAMDQASRAELAAKMRARPERYVAQQQVALSTTPVYTEHGLEARHMVLRAFATWDGSRYIVLPGGLSRVSRESHSPAISLHSGGGTKDTWVSGSGGEPVAAARPVPGAIAAHPSWSNLPSRVAENLFWLGRYAERLEDHVRLMRALLPALSGEEDFGRTATLESVVRLMIGLDYLPAPVANASLGEQLWQVQRLLTSLVRDESRPTGLGWNLKNIRRVALNLRERLSADTWRVLQQIEHDFAECVPSLPGQPFVSETNLLDSAIVTLTAFAGLVMENTTRGHGWHFLELGRRLERAGHMAELLQAGVADAPEDIEPYLRIVLFVADSSITYRTRYLTALRTDLVLDLLLADETNPRSVGFQLASLLQHLESLPSQDPMACSIERGLVCGGLQALRITPMEGLARRDENGRLSNLTSLLHQLKSDMYDLSDALAAHYLSPVVSARFVSSR
jgi:uncharacterized circularly permuted ATP-grasp superfamily protein/uncharacterized alpha-E superfamily protein